MGTTRKSENFESQETQIIKHLKSGKTITSLEALRLFGCFRLASRIYTLRHKRKHNIKTIMIELSNGKRIAQYKLIS